jgi:hypothetical protein
MECLDARKKPVWGAEPGGIFDYSGFWQQTWMLTTGKAQQPNLIVKGFKFLPALGWRRCQLTPTFTTPGIVVPVAF